LALLKSIAREIVFPAAVAMHLEKLFSNMSHHNRIILCYHGVVDIPQHNISLGPIATMQFEQHLAYFKQNFDVVTQDTIFEMYRTNFVPKKKTLALTFDDGYENNYTTAYPLLKKYNFPATMYVISQCLESENSITWYDYIDLMRKDVDISKIDVTSVNRPKPDNINELRLLIKSLNISERRLLFAEIRKQVKIESYATQQNRQHWKLMNAEQLRELSESGLVEIGAHTQNHPNLGELKLNDVISEVETCKINLENVLQKDVYSIAFPDGSYTDEVKVICIKAGYKNLLAVDYKCASDKKDKSILPRAGVSSTTTYEANMVHLNLAFKSSGF
jgi:peptidoglycan/xylan/chitin deacetylase (PgdA/CDA1 family)